MSDTAADAAPGRQTKRGGAVDLDAMTVPELVKLREAIESAIQQKQAQAKASLLDKWRAEAAESGLSFEAIVPGQAAQPAQGQGRKRRSGGTVAAKYKGPNGELWSGRGRQPQWVKDAEAHGKNISEFLIKS